MTRSADEKIRLTHHLAQMRACLDSFEIALRMDAPILETAQVVADSALRLATTAARRDAYVIAERDRSPIALTPPPELPPAGTVFEVDESDPYHARLVEVAPGTYSLSFDSERPVPAGRYVIEDLEPGGRELRVRRIEPHDAKSPHTR